MTNKKQETNHRENQNISSQSSNAAPKPPRQQPPTVEAGGVNDDWLSGGMEDAPAASSTPKPQGGVRPQEQQQEQGSTEPPVKQESPITTTPESSITTAPDIEFEIDYEDDAEGGSGIDARYKSIDLIRIIQANSPQGKQRDPKYVEGAKPGDMFNTGTEKLYPKETGFCFVLGAMLPVLVEWVIRDEDGSGGGFVAIHGINSGVMSECKRMEYKGKTRYVRRGTEHEIVETLQYFGLAFEGEENFDITECSVVCIPMSSGLLNAARKFNSGMDQAFKKIVQKDKNGNPIIGKDGNPKTKPVRLMPFHQVWQFTTDEIRSKSGHYYHTFKPRYLGEIIEVLGPGGVDAYQQVKMIREAALAGEFVANTSHMDDSDVEFEFGANSADDGGDGDGGAPGDGAGGGPGGGSGGDEVYETTAERVSDSGSGGDDPFA